MGMKYNWMQNSYLTCLGSTDRMFSREFHCIYRTQPVLFHRCILNRLGSQLARSSPIRSMVSTGCQSAHQLAGTRSHPSSSSPVGTALDQSDSSRLLRQQYGSSSYTQAGRDPFHIAIQQNAGTLSSSGPVWNSTHPKSPPWSQEFNHRCPVSSEQSKSNRMVASSGNLTQVVLCLRDPPSEHVRRARHRTGWLQFTFHPTRTTELGWSTPSPYLGTA